jgi:hypothetical protein
MSTFLVSVLYGITISQLVMRFVRTCNNDLYDCRSWTWNTSQTVLNFTNAIKIVYIVLIFPEHLFLTAYVGLPGLPPSGPRVKGLITYLAQSLICPKSDTGFVRTCNNDLYDCRSWTWNTSQTVLNFTNAIKIVYIMLRSDQKRYLCCHGDAINKV